MISAARRTAPRFPRCYRRRGEHGLPTRVTVEDIGLGRPARGRGGRARLDEPCRPPTLASLPVNLARNVCASDSSIDSLYSHQRRAWDSAARGEHIIVTTGTASGKTLAFNLPVLDALAREPKNRALYLYRRRRSPGPAASAPATESAGRARRDLRRRHGAGPALADPQVGEPHPDQPGHAARRRVAHTTTAGETCSRTSATSWSTRLTSTAACSARTSATFFAA